jgi:hypothetical protein
MTIEVTYKARNYHNQVEGDRFVRADRFAGYVWCVRDKFHTNYDLLQGTCDAEDLPEDVRLAADVLLGRAFGYVEWPR